jgi:hypothetical protein
MTINNVTHKNLEFIQTTCSVEFTLDMSSLAFLSAAVEWIVWIHSIIKNKPNFSQFFKRKRRFHKKTNPKQIQYWPKNQGDKANTNPISGRSTAATLYICSASHTKRITENLH